MTDAVALTTNARDEILERVLVTGDLSRLSAQERTAYYLRVCESLGLNPLTKPFDYITLNGRLVLYAKRDATDQLRRLRQISVAITARESLGDLYLVTARATDSTGRMDESIGVVAISGLRGEPLANAIMRAETKAKRRVTLSICGLGWLDETEVADAGKSDGPAPPLAPAGRAAGAATAGPSDAPPGPQDDKTAAEQRKALFDAWKRRGLSLEALRQWLHVRYGTHRTDTFSREQLSEMIARIEQAPRQQLEAEAAGERDAAELVVDAQRRAQLSDAQLAAVTRALFGTDDWTALSREQMHELVGELEGRALGAQENEPE
jgi:hypothetical protein